MTDVMDGSTSQIPQVVNLLGKEQLQQMLEQFAPIIPFPLCVLDLQGNIVVGTNSQGFCDVRNLRFHIDCRQHVVEATTETGHVLRTLTAPSERKVMGVINMTDKRSSDMFSSDDVRLLTAIASQAAMSRWA